jgi:hypothetical protein
MKTSKNTEPKHDNSSKHNNFHVPKQVGTRVNHGWDTCALRTSFFSSHGSKGKPPIAAKADQFTSVKQPGPKTGVLS